MNIILYLIYVFYFLSFWGWTYSLTRCYNRLLTFIQPSCILLDILCSCQLKLTISLWFCVLNLDTQYNARRIYRSCVSKVHNSITWERSTEISACLSDIKRVLSSIDESIDEKIKSNHNTVLSFVSDLPVTILILYFIQYIVHTVIIYFYLKTSRYSFMLYVDALLEHTTNFSLQLHNKNFLTVFNFFLII